MKIEKGVPVPKIIFRKKTNKPLEEMKIGDSVLFESVKEGRGFAVSFRNYIKYHKLDWKCLERKLKDGSVRVWRIK